ANLFALRATDPAAMRQADDPVGPGNIDWLQRIVNMTVNQMSRYRGGRVICAWGTHGSYMDQDQNVLGWIEDICDPMCLGVTQDGQPRHPLYVPYSADLVAFNALVR
ncbi:MAG TPA: DUF1643 domain-containing protein, partial [Isosphaeraceae bacterium]|nr:DUF1643 domain-containing protein [Isosphaeraceae bacterium]